MTLCTVFIYKKKKKGKYYSVTKSPKIMACKDCLSNIISTVWSYHEAVISKLSCPTLESSAVSSDSQNAKQFSL